MTLSGFIKKIKIFLKKAFSLRDKKNIIYLFKVKKEIKSHISLIERIREEMKLFEMSLDTLFAPANTRYFIVLTPGHSGSVWLTKVLNSHPDVFCFHEGVLQRTFPLRWRDLKEEDRISWLYAVRESTHYPKIFQAIGDVGSVTPEIACLPQIQKLFRIFGLTRNGILFVRSQLSSLVLDLPASFREKIESDFQKALEKFPSLKGLNKRDFKTKLFIYTCFRWRKHLEAPVLKTYRIEDLNDINNLCQAFQEITGLDIPQKETIEKMIGQRVNPHIEEKEYNPQKVYFQEWSKEQRFIFDAICGKKMKEFYSWPLKPIFKL